MSMHSLLIGDDSLNDQLPRYAGTSMTDPLCRGNLTGDLRRNGYAYKHFSIENILGQRWASDNETISDLKRTSYLQNHISFLRKWLDERRKDAKNFVAIFQNDGPHMASDDDAKQTAETFPERTHIAYKALDESIAAFMGILQEYSHLEDTIFAFYGDHGDELWTHTLSRGFAHGITPYTSLVWTPMFIYDNGENAEVTAELTSIIDLREMLLKMILPQPSTFPIKKCLAKVRQSPFAGIDHGERTREFAFSQNLYALQLEYSDLEKTLTKGYSVTDGVYRLVASSAGKWVKESGLELYYERLDPTNSRNLLDFFNLGASGDIIGVKPFSTIGDRTFPLLFTEETTKHLISAYHRLKRELYSYVRAKEAEAIKLNKGERHVMPESAFKFARKRLRHDYNE
jgi:hypothetical protein